jgi:hypothetical protein
MKAQEIKELSTIPRCAVSVTQYSGALHFQRREAKRKARVKRAKKEAVR